MVSENAALYQWSFWSWEPFPAQILRALKIFLKSGLYLLIFIILENSWRKGKNTTIHKHTCSSCQSDVTCLVASGKTPLYPWERRKVRKADNLLVLLWKQLSSRAHQKGFQRRPGVPRPLWGVQCRRCPVASPAVQGKESQGAVGHPLSNPVPSLAEVLERRQQPAFRV